MPHESNLVGLVVGAPHRRWWKSVCPTPGTATERTMDGMRKMDSRPADGAGFSKMSPIPRARACWASAADWSAK
eukprot:11195192-Lingulodinium_polyedra.AAC.1